MNERRASGLHKTIFSDDKGNKIETYHFSANKASTWVGLIVGVAAIISIVFGAVRFGVGVEVKDIIRLEVQDENGVIRREMKECAEEVVAKRVARIQADLTDVENQVKTNTHLNVRLEERQIAMDKKIDQQHRETLDAISHLRRNTN